MDALAIILRIVREQIESTGVPPDALQDALAEAEHRARRSLGGSVHHISRVQAVPIKARIVELAACGLSAQQIAARLEITDRYARMVLAQLRDGGDA